MLNFGSETTRDIEKNAFFHFRSIDDDGDGSIYNSIFAILLNPESIDVVVGGLLIFFYGGKM